MQRANCLSGFLKQPNACGEEQHFDTKHDWNLSPHVVPSMVLVSKDGSAFAEMTRRLMLQSIIGTDGARALATTR